MKRLLVATRNRGKLKEIRAVLDDLVEELLCAADLPELQETVEDGATFVDNALKKAREACLASGLPVLADDSGLVVDGLDGRPGVCCQPVSPAPLQTMPPTTASCSLNWRCFPWPVVRLPLSV